jgi:hypothetical protein
MVNRLHRSAERLLLLIAGLTLLAIVAAAFAQHLTPNRIRQPERGSASMHRPIRILLKGEKR